MVLIVVTQGVALPPHHPRSHIAIGVILVSSVIAASSHRVAVIVVAIGEGHVVERRQVAGCGVVGVGRRPVDSPAPPGRLGAGEAVRRIVTEGLRLRSPGLVVLDGQHVADRIVGIAQVLQGI